MRELDIQVTTSLEDVLYIKRPNKIARGILHTCRKLLKKYTGEKLFVPVSQALQLFGGKSPELWSIIDTIHALQSLGIIKHFSKNRARYPDEPRYFGYRARYSNSGHSGGVDFFSERRAMWKTVGETVERYLWSQYDFFSENQTFKSYKEVMGKSLNIFSLEKTSPSKPNNHRPYLLAVK